MAEIWGLPVQKKNGLPLQNEGRSIILGEFLKEYPLDKI